MGWGAEICQLVRSSHGFPTILDDYFIQQDYPAERKETGMEKALACGLNNGAA